MDRILLSLTTMMSRTTSTTIVAAALAAWSLACSPVEKGETVDTVETGTAGSALRALNGMSFNGMSFNGRAFNGMSFNGRAFNGRAFNGMGFNGRSFNGIGLNAFTLEVHQSELSLINVAERQRMKLDRLGGGVELWATDPATGDEVRVRIEGPQTVVPVDGYIRKPVLSYLLSFFDDATGTWRPGLSDEAGNALWAIPLAGYWNIAPSDLGTARGGRWVDAPDAITFAARGFVLAKCVELGYRPWEPQLTQLHQTCVRALRADYCGDGRTFTRDHTLIDLYDVLGVQVRETDPAPGAPERTWTPEAEWNADGARCLAGERIQDWEPGESPDATCFGVPLVDKYHPRCALPISSANRSQWADSLLRTDYLGWSVPNQE